MAVRAALIAIPVTIVVVAAAPVIVRIIGPGLSDAVADQAGSVLRIYALSIPGTASPSSSPHTAIASGRVWTSGLSTSAYALVWFGLLFVPAFTDDVQSAALAGLIATGIQVLAAYVMSSAGVHARGRSSPHSGSAGRTGCDRSRARRGDRRSGGAAARPPVRLAAAAGLGVAALLCDPDHRPRSARLRAGSRLQPAHRQSGEAERRDRARTPGSG